MAFTNITAEDFGLYLKVRIVQDKEPVDISDYTTLQFILRAPNGDKSTVTAEFFTDGEDGYMGYAVEDGVLNQAGTWRMQARIAKTGVELTSGTISVRAEQRL